MSKNIFVDRHKQANVVEYHENFTKKKRELKLYMVEFDEFGIIKPEVYLLDDVIGEDNSRLAIRITYNECIFLANNEVWRA